MGMMIQQQQQQVHNPQQQRQQDRQSKRRSGSNHGRSSRWICKWCYLHSSSSSSIRNVVVLLSLSLLLAVLRPQFCMGGSISSVMGTEPLIEWLDQLQIHLPDIDYTEFISIQVHDLMCTHFVVDHIESSYIPSSNNNNNNNNISSSSYFKRNNNTVLLPQLTVSIQNISAYCTGIYSVSPGSVRGTVQIQLGTTLGTTITPNTNSRKRSVLHVVESVINITDDDDDDDDAAALEWTMDILDDVNNTSINETVSNRIRQPGAIRTIQVATQVRVVALHCTGGVSAQIIQLFQTVIVHRINEEIQLLIVRQPFFPTTIDPMISKYIQQMNHILQPYLISYPNSSSSTPATTAHDTHLSTTMHSTGIARTMTTYKNNHHNYYHLPTNDELQPLVFNNDGIDTSIAASSRSSNSTEPSSSSTIVQYDTDLPILYHMLQNMNTFIGNHLHSGFLRLTPTMTNTTTNTTSCGGFSNGINGLLHDVFNITSSNDDASWTLPLHFHPISYVVAQYSKKLTFVIHTVTISGPGLANINTMNLLRPMTTTTRNTTNITQSTTTDQSRNQTTHFHNEIELLSNVSISVNVSIQISDIVPKADGNGASGTSSNTSSNVLNETFVVQMDMHQLHAALDVSVDWKKYYLQNIVTIGMIRTIVNELLTSTTANERTHDYLSSSSNSETIRSPTMNCFLQGIDQIFVTGLFAMVNLSRVSIRPIIPSSVPPFVHSRNSTATTNHQQLEQDIDHLINTVMDLVSSEYPLLLTTAIRGYIQTNNTVQNYINDYLSRHVKPGNNSTTKTDCTPPNSSGATASSHTAYTKGNHLYTGDPFHWFNISEIAMLRQFNLYLNESTTLTKINEYVDCSIDTIQDMIHDTYIHDHHHDEKAPNGISSAAMTRSTMHFTDFSIKRFGQFQQIQFMSPNIDGLQIDNSFLWNNSIEPAQELPTLFLALQIDYQPLNITSMINVTILLNDIQWGIDTIIHFDDEKFRQMTVMQLFSHVHCILALVNSTDFGILVTDRHLQTLQFIVNTTIQMHTTNETMDMLIDSNHFPDVQTFASSSFDWFVDMMRDIIGSASKSALADSQSVCYGEKPSTNDDNYANGNIYDSMKPIFLILLAVFLFAQPAILLMKDTSYEESIDPTDHDLFEPLLNHQLPAELDIAPNDGDDDDDTSYGSESQCFMMHKSIPLFVQYAVPILIIATIVLLLSSNLSVGATVDVLITNIYRNDQDIQIPSLFEFSLYNTARDMWRAQIYPLFFLVLVFSGIWPYLKLFLMLFAWMGPTSLISPTFRGHLLLKLDALSKFSLVDTYVLIVMMVAFRYRLPLLEESSLSVYVVPQFGFYGFLVATSASLLIGHVLVYYHRHVEITTTTLPDRVLGGEAVDIPSTSIISLGNHAYHLRDGTKRRLTHTFQNALGVWLLVVLVMFVVGITQKCFVFEFGGLAGLLLSDGTNQEAYSVISFAAAIPTSTEHSSWMSTILLQFVFIFYTIIMPLAAVIFLAIVWMIPMSWSSQYCLLVLAEIANAWSALEVFCLSIVAALLEIDTLANFMVGHKCDWIDHLLVSYRTTIGIDTCYSVTAMVSWNAMFLVVGAILHSTLISVVLRFVQLSVHERLLEINDDDMISDPRQSFLHRLIERSWEGWMFENAADNDVGNDSTMINDIHTENTAIVDDDVDVLPVFSEEILTTPWENVNDEVWKDSIEHDETWKEWKEATNVT